MNKKRNILALIIIFVLFIFEFFADKIGVKSNFVLSSCDNMECFGVLFLIVLIMVLFFYFVKYIFKKINKKLNFKGGKK